MPKRDITTSIHSTCGCIRAASSAKTCALGPSNRYYFQNAVPRKDAILISRSEDPAFRREWTLRLLDHDGFGKDEAGSRAGSN